MKPIYTEDLRNSYSGLMSAGLPLSGWLTDIAGASAPCARTANIP